MVNERYYTVNLRDVKSSYEKLRNKRGINIPALYNAIKYWSKLGSERQLIDLKAAKMIYKISNNSSVLGEAQSLLLELYKIQTQLKGVHILCDDISSYEKELTLDNIKQLQSLTTPYLIEFEAVCDNNPASVMVRFNPTPNGVTCSADFWTGKEFRHYTAMTATDGVLELSGDGGFSVIDVVSPEKLLSMCENPIMNDFSKRYATALNIIAAYGDAMNSIPEVVTKVEKQYTKSKTINVVVDKPTESVMSKEFEYHERIVNLNKYVQERVREKKEWQGGHHASPVPHMRSGYYRRCKNGEYVIKDGQYVKVPRGQGRFVYVSPCSVNGGANIIHNTVYKV